MAELRITGVATVKLRTNLSIGHLRAAALFAGRCRPLEERYKWPATEPVILEHAAYAKSSVILSVAALEALVNEYHLDAIDGSSSALGTAMEASGKIRDLWDTVERQSLLRKFEWMLRLASVPVLDRGSPVVQAISDLIEIRDYLIHYKPEWSDAPRRNEKLEKRLQNKFALNRLSAKGQFFIPHRCLGYGCGAWAVMSVQEYSRSIAKQLRADWRFAACEDEVKRLLTASAEP